MRSARIKEMADYISKVNTIRLPKLAEIFGVSIYTVRRDIDELEKRGIVRKIYGGVTIEESAPHPEDFDYRNTVLKEEKTMISERAASLVDDGDIIYIDGGTTTYNMPDNLADKKNITVITNNFYAMVKLSKMKQHKLIVLGGELDRRTSSISGLQTIECLKNLNVTKAFISCTGVSESFKVTNYTLVEAELKRECMKISEQSYLLADHTKFGEGSLVNYASLNDFDGIITDIPLDDHYETHLNNQNILCMCNEKN